ncbi:hypothetical protein V7166_22970 [Bacillus thuringiensis]
MTTKKKYKYKSRNQRYWMEKREGLLTRKRKRGREWLDNAPRKTTVNGKGEILY